MAGIDSTFRAAWGAPGLDEKSLPRRGDCLWACLEPGQAAAWKPCSKATRGRWSGSVRYLGFIPRARIRSRRVFLFIPSSAAARSWLPLVRASAAARSGASTAASATW